jgi:putative oxygen-independent coproporphyrinogen III oxidase
MIAKPEVMKEYVSYLIQDLHQHANQLSTLDTIYIGGGTPSAIDISLLESLLKTIESLVDLNDIIEYTIECNVEDITIELIKLLKHHRINRLSIGVQSFNPMKLAILNRNHHYLDVLSKIAMIRTVYEQQIAINIDLMYAIGDETLEILDQDIDFVLTCKPDHISIYSLILEEKTTLHHLFQLGQYKRFSEDLESDMYFHIRNRLLNVGYIHYETSNYGLPGKFAIHNLKYWNHTPYLGIGAAASSFDGTRRTTNPKNLKQYYQYVSHGDETHLETELLTEIDLMKEMIIVGLRKTDGISMDQFYERFQISMFEQFPIIEVMIETHWLVEENRNIRLATDKLYLANAVLEKFI